MACIRKRKKRRTRVDGTTHERECWVVDWRDGAGARRARFFETRREAEQFRDGDDFQDSRKKRARSVVDQEITVRAYSERWLVIVAAHLKPRTLESYRDTLRLHILPALGNVRVRDVRKDDVTGLLAAKLKSGLSRNTVRIMQGTLRAMLNAAADAELLRGPNPAAKLGRAMRLVTPKAVRQEEIKALTREQLDKFLTTARTEQPRLAPLWLLQARTGLRPGEAYALRWEDLDLAAREARIVGTLSDDGTRVDTPKSNHGRTVDLSRGLVAALERLQTERKAEKLRRGWAELPPWVVCAETGGLLDPHNVRRAFRKVLTKAKLPGHFTPHCLRHTYASLLLVNGESMYYVQRQLGHASITLTVDTYGRWLPAGNKAAVDRLDGAGSPEDSGSEAAVPPEKAVTTR